jgi:hypothetical protein
MHEILSSLLSVRCVRSIVRRRVSRGAMVVLGVLSLGTHYLDAATSLDHYFAHDAVEDQHGVIAPWYQGQNGQLDLRVRIAAETLKRYPWMDPKGPYQVPAYIISGRWEISADGVIKVLPASEWGNEWGDRDFGYRSYYILSGLVDYYRYTGDPAAFAHLELMADHLLDYGLTSEAHPWPKFPISVPEKYIQLDIVAQQGWALLEAYQMTGNPRWLDAAKHWGDLFAAKMRTDTSSRLAPWDRYATPETSRHENRLTGGVTLILEFLEELIRLGYAGQGGGIVRARDASRRYIRDVLLPAWTVNETWGRYFWDWDAAVQTIATTDAAVRCFLADRGYFPNWKVDSRNIMGLYLNHTSVDPASNADVYSGAWAYPESCGCCTRSLDYSPMEMAAVYAQFGVMADDEWAREMARRQILLSTYHFHENGVVEDNIDKGQIVANRWFKIVHPMPLKYVLETMAWLPELGANRENHIMRSSSVVQSVVYGKGDIQYSTFDAPPGTVDVLRLAFLPASVRAGLEALKVRDDLTGNGYTLRKLANGDCIVAIRHDGQTSVVVRGSDPQDVVDDGGLIYRGPWTQERDTRDFGGTIHAGSSAGAEVSLRFRGNQVRLIGRADPAGGLADVYLDGIKRRVGVDCWNPSKTRCQQVLYYINGLRNDEHELKVVVTGKGNPHSSGSEVYIDSVQSSLASGESGFGSGGGPTGPQRMIFGYTGRKPYLDSKGHEWLPGTEFVVRSGRFADSVASAWWADPDPAPVAKTQDPELYRYGVHAPEFWVNLTVGPGRYNLSLKMMERRETSGQLTTISINGKTVKEDLDVQTSAGGKNTALDLLFDNIAPKNGIIEVRLANTHGGEAALQALELVPVR